ncbi:MAG TPA: FecR family protein, partial [Gemmatimonadaceae bacterium]
MRAMRLLTGTFALLLGSAVSLHAQDPSARVARASYLQGEVSFRPATVDDWTSATLNYPLTTGDHLWTDTASRAELQVGANAIRLGPESAFEILSLDDSHLQIRLSQGEALVSVNDLEDDNLEIDTPTGAVTLLRDGTYRVDVSEDGATSTVTVRSGNAEVATSSS